MMQSPRLRFFSIIVLSIATHYQFLGHNVLCAPGRRPDNAAMEEGPTSGALPAIVIFGDSLSDTGIVANETNCLVPSPNIYWRGRFSNGPVWVDHLVRIAAARNRTAAGNKTIVQNYAHGGATACSGISLTVPDLSEQISSYLDSAPSATADDGTSNATSNVPFPAAFTADGGSCMPLQPLPWRAAFNASSMDCGPMGRLFIVFIGHNDILHLKPQEMSDPRVLQQSLANVTNCTVAALEKLMAALALPPAVAADGGINGGGGGCGDRIVVWHLVPLQMSPLVPEQSKPVLKAALEAHNSALDASLTPLRRRYPKGPTLEVYDVYSAAAAELETAQTDFNMSAPCVRMRNTVRMKSGYSILEREIDLTTGAVGADVCYDPNHYASYDGLHPSSAAHLRAFAHPFASHLGWA